MEGVSMSRNYSEIVDLVRKTLIIAGSTFTEDKKRAYNKAISVETNCNSKWVLETILENAKAAEANQSPLCDDTGIPHLVLEVGETCSVTGQMLDAIREGVAAGLRDLPGRPMAIMGNDLERIDQSGGLSPNPEDVQSAPILLLRSNKNIVRLYRYLLMGL